MRRSIEGRKLTAPSQFVGRDMTTHSHRRDLRYFVLAFRFACDTGSLQSFAVNRRRIGLLRQRTSISRRRKQSDDRSGAFCGRLHAHVSDAPLRCIHLPVVLACSGRIAGNVRALTWSDSYVPRRLLQPIRPLFFRSRRSLADEPPLLGLKFSTGALLQPPLLVGLLKYYEIGFVDLAGE